jgi:hypothetical protein
MKMKSKPWSSFHVAASALLLLLTPEVFTDEAYGKPPAGLASGETQPFKPDLHKGAQCLIEITQLHPTQAAVGYFEVKQKAAKLSGKKPSKLQEYLAEHMVPIVIGPGGAAYLTDHHHLARALWDAKLSKTVNAKVIENWSDAGPEFWKRMKEHIDDTTKEPVPLVYLYDENGNPLPGSETLPKTIADLKDDPFRSLIYILIDAGVLEKDPTPFSEFHEAQYYRQKFKEAGFTLENSKEGFDKAVAEAKTLPLPPK